MKSFYFNDDELLLEPMVEINRDGVLAASDEIDESNKDCDSTPVLPVLTDQLPQPSEENMGSATGT